MKGSMMLTASILVVLFCFLLVYEEGRTVGVLCISFRS